MKAGAAELILKALRFKSWPQEAGGLPQFQSHRGFCVDGARENTLASLAKAQAKNFLMVEIDVRLSEDEVPVLAHDQNLNRLVGVDKLVSAMTALELAQYQFPSLEEVLKTPNRPKKINIEIKKDDRQDWRLEQKIIEVIKETQTSEDVLVSSFNPFSMIPFAKSLPEVPRALLIDHDPLWSSLQLTSYLRLLGSCIAQPHMINWPHQLLNRQLVQFLKNNGVPIAVWTVNEEAQARELFSWGVDSVITDRILPEMQI